MKRTRLRWTVGLGLGALIGAIAFVACGSDETGVGAICEGTTCDGGSPETIVGNDAAGADGDGGMLADAPLDGANSDSNTDAETLPSCGDAGAAGTLDETFGDGGIVWLPYAGGTAQAVATQADGKIVIGGKTTTTAGDAAFAVVRLLANGTPDPSFGVNGLSETVVGNTTHQITGLVVQPDGKIVAAGYTRFVGQLFDFALLRYMPNGSLDTKFGASGFVLADFGGRDDRATWLSVLGDGRITVSGTSSLDGTSATTDFAVARFDATGVPDATFGAGGKTTIDIRGTADSPGTGLLLPGGGLVVAGLSRETTALTSRSDVAAVQLPSSGQVATAFGNSGKLVTTFGGTSQTANALTRDPGGNVLLAGAFGPDFGVLRVSSVGALDPSFNLTGVAMIDFEGRTDHAVFVQVEPDGRILIAGSGTGVRPAPDPDQANELVRLLPNGSLDVTFGVGGRVVTPSPPNMSLGVNGATTTACHIITVGGWSYNNSTLARNAMGVARYYR